MRNHDDDNHDDDSNSRRTNNEKVRLDANLHVVQEGEDATDKATEEEERESKMNEEKLEQPAEYPTSSSQGNTTNKLKKKSPVVTTATSQQRVEVDSSNAIFAIRMLTIARDERYDGNGVGDDDINKDLSNQAAGKTLLDEALVNPTQLIRDSNPDRHNHLSRPGAYSIIPNAHHGVLRRSSNNDILHECDDDNDDPSTTFLQSMEEQPIPTPHEAHLVVESHDEDEEFEQQLQKRINERTIVATNVAIATTEAMSLRRGNGNTKKRSDGSRHHCCPTRKSVLLLLIFIIGIIFLVTAFGVILFASNTTDANSSDNGPQHQVTSPPILVPHDGKRGQQQLREMKLRDILSLDSFNGTAPSSHQYQALQWLTYNDTVTCDMLILMDSTSNKNIYAASRTLIIERYVAVLLHITTGGTDHQWSNNLNFLNSNQTVCDWPPLEVGERLDTKQGIGCDTDGQIISIQLDNMNLVGTLPTELVLLSRLRSISMDINSQLGGTIPSEYGSLTNLVKFQISSNSISGTIPPSLGSLRKLEFLSLGACMLTGTMPPGLVTLESLERLSLSSNFLSGTIPFGEFANSRATAILRSLWLDMNQLQGPIPTLLYQLTSLEQLTLSQNDFNGSVATEIGNLENLYALYMFDNRLTGTIPSEIGMLSNILELYVNQNQLTGTIPTEVGNLNRAEDLALSANQLSGTVPSEIGNMNGLHYLDLGSNNFVGSIPSSLGGPSSTLLLEELNLANTSLSYNAFDSICNESRPTVAQIYADCGVTDGENLLSSPEVSCPCCTQCCNDITGQCHGDVSKMCEVAGNQFASEFGSSYDSQRNSTCECVGEGDVKNIMSCNDDPDPVNGCMSCNHDKSICALNTKYGFVFDPNTGRQLSWQNTFQYTIGVYTNTTVKFVWNDLAYENDNFENECTVEVNGQRCRGCREVECDDGFVAFNVLCDNVDGGQNLDMCDDNYDDGVLTVLSLLDKTRLNGCAPIIVW